MIKNRYYSHISKKLLKSNCNNNYEKQANELASCYTFNSSNEKKKFVYNNNYLKNDLFYHQKSSIESNFYTSDSENYNMMQEIDQKINFSENNDDSHIQKIIFLNKKKQLLELMLTNVLQELNSIQEIYD